MIKNVKPVLSINLESNISETINVETKEHSANADETP